MRKIKIILSILIWMIIITYGFIKVNCTLPNEIKSKSDIRTYCQTKPFDFIIEIKDSKYFFHINKKVFLGIKDNSINRMTNFVNVTSNGLNSGIKNVREETEQISENFFDKFFYKKVQ